MGEARRKRLRFDQAARWFQGRQWVSEGRVDLLEKLVEEGFDLNTRDLFSESTLLHLAAWEEHDVAVQWLTSQGAVASLETRDKSGHTALMLAARSPGKKGGDCVKMLVEAGADWEATNLDGDTAEGLAGNPETKDFLANLRTAKEAQRLHQALPTVGGVDNHERSLCG